MHCFLNLQECTDMHLNTFLFLYWCKVYWTFCLLFIEDFIHNNSKTSSSWKAEKVKDKQCYICKYTESIYVCVKSKFNSEKKNIEVEFIL